MIQKKVISLLIGILVVMSSQNQLANAQRLDVTDKVEYIGTPFLNRYPSESKLYARNVWDMIAFNGKLYLGAGNSSNYGPSTGAGPVPIICYDPESNSFETVFTVDEDQVDVFYNFDNKLYIPGHDPRESWEFGNFYSFSPNGGWQKYRNIPNGIHTYSLVSFGNKLFAGLATKNKTSIAISDDGGVTWQPQPLESYRIYDFLVVKNKLYATGTFFPAAFEELIANSNISIDISCYEYTSSAGFSPRSDLRKSDLFFANSQLPKENTRFKGIRRVFFKEQTLFIGAEIHNDHQSLPFGVFAASSLEPDNISIEKIPIPASTTPWDILQYGESVYILLEHHDKNPKEISVIQSSDLKTWNELLYFQMTTFARSFALLNNTLYFSAGGEVSDPALWESSEISPDTGKLYKVVITDASIEEQLDAQYEAGKQYCIDNPTECGWVYGYDEGFAAGQATCDNPVSSDGCALLETDFDIAMPCIDVYGTKLSVNLEKITLQDDPSGYYWKLNLQ